MPRKFASVPIIIYFSRYCMIQSARSMWGKTMIFLPLRELRRSDVSPDLPPVASHRYWGIMAEQMMAVFLDSTSTKRVLRQISCCQVKQVWKILIQRSRSEARPYILLLIYFILLFRPSISPLLIEYFMAFLMGEMSRWTLFTKLTTSP